MIQGAWSGRAVFADLHGIGQGVVFEHPTSYPLPGEILLYPGDEMGSTGKYIIRAPRYKIRIRSIANETYNWMDWFREYGQTYGSKSCKCRVSALGS
ncbi:hypothetical protein CA596_07480 [Paenibacillus odorifer]|nr:hypothetical protein CA596_07480 [Paenibacillus odorifer]